MGAVKILSENNIKRITGISGKQYKKVAWHTSEIIVKQILTLSEYMAVVNSILSDCQAPGGSIALELADFAIRANIISAYGFVQMPEDIETLFYIVYASDLYETICSAVNKAQLEAIKQSVIMYLKN